MIRLSLIAVTSLVALAACNPPAPYEQQVGAVGFGSYSDYQRQREAALASGQPTGPGPVNSYAPTATAGAIPGYGAPISGGTGTAVTPGGLPTSVVAAVDAVQPGAQPFQPVAPLPQQPLAGAAQPLPADGTTATAAAGALPVNNTGISDENDFSAVASRESIESDKARIAANKANYI